MGSQFEMTIKTTVLRRLPAMWIFTVLNSIDPRNKYFDTKNFKKKIEKFLNVLDYYQKIGKILNSPVRNKNIKCQAHR